MLPLFHVLIPWQGCMWDTSSRGLNPHPLHWKGKSQPLDHQGSPYQSNLFHQWLWIKMPRCWRLAYQFWENEDKFGFIVHHNKHRNTYLPSWEGCKVLCTLSKANWMNRDRVAVWEDEKDLEVDGGDGCTGMWIDLVPLNCSLREG